MSRALLQFNANIQNVKDLTTLYNVVHVQMPHLEDKMQDMLRAEIVLAVSAFDCYIHDLIRYGMIDIFHTPTTLSEAYKNFGITLHSLHEILNTTDDQEKIRIFDNEIRKVNGYKTFQDPDKVTKGLSVLGVENLWLKVAQQQNSTLTPSQLNNEKKELVRRLSAIVTRRNQIAHESDLDNLGNKNPIDRANTTIAVDFIIDLCKNIDLVFSFT